MDHNINVDHHSGVETPHMKMCSDACTKVGTPNTYMLGGGNASNTLMMGGAI